MTRPVRLHSLASAELTEAVRWYESKREGLGAELLHEVAKAIESLVATPDAGRQLSADRSTRRVLLDRFPYQVIYRRLPGALVIVAVAHLKRRPGYWKSRR